MITKGSDLSMNAQRTLKERLTISLISQWSLNDLSINAKFFHLRKSWEINERTRISHRNSFFGAFERSLRARAYFWWLNGRPTISVLCKGPLSDVHPLPEANPEREVMMLPDCVVTGHSYGDFNGINQGAAWGPKLPQCYSFYSSSRGGRSLSQNQHKRIYTLKG